MYKLECIGTYIRNINHEFIRKRGSLTKFGLIGNNVMYYLNISYVICHVIILNFRLKLVKNNTIKRIQHWQDTVWTVLFTPHYNIDF